MLKLKDEDAKKINEIRSKWRNRYSFNYDIVFHARAMYFYRWELKVDTAGGIYSARSFRIKSDLNKYRLENWKGRKFWINDCWLRASSETLADMKTLARLFKWRNYENLHDAPT